MSLLPTRQSHQLVKSKRRRQSMMAGEVLLAAEPACRGGSPLTRCISGLA